MRMDRGGAIAGVRCRSESAAGITKPISGFVKRLSAAGNETFFASCTTQEAKRGSFSGPALCRKQKRVFFGPCVAQEAKRGSFSGPALRRKQKGGLFRALRCAGSKKGVFFGPCVAQEAKSGSFSGPALRREQKRPKKGRPLRWPPLCISPCGGEER